MIIERQEDSIVCIVPGCDVLALRYHWRCSEHVVEWHRKRAEAIVAWEAGRNTPCPNVEHPCG